MAKPDERDDAAALMVLAVMALLVLAAIGAGVAAFVSYAGGGGM
jgi:hypothetical protein